MITQRLILDGDYPDGVWSCPGCGAHFTDGVLTHPDVCTEIKGAAQDLSAELAEARAEITMIRDHANRYCQAIYGPDYVYRAPETFGNLVERWIWAVSAEVPEMAHACIADIERWAADRREAAARELAAEEGSDGR